MHNIINGSETKRFERREFKTIKGINKRGFTLRKVSLLIFINREWWGVCEFPPRHEHTD